MQNFAKKPGISGEQPVDVDLEELNERIDRAIARFDQMRRDYRFLASPAQHSRKG